MKSVIRSLIVLVSFTVLLCGIYPAVVTGLGNVFFPHETQGSLIEKDGKVIGSELIGQAFTKAQYFQGRVSAAGNGYDAANSSGSNLGPTSKKLMDRVKADVERIKKENPTLKDGEVPTELITASGSGLDPHISPRAAEVQLARVAANRKVSEAEIKKIVDRFTERPELGVLGDATVNVLLVNLELDKAYPVVEGK